MKTKIFVIMMMVIIFCSVTISLAAEQDQLNKDLLLSAGTGSLSDVKKAIALGADVNAAFPGGWTALYVAAQDGHTEIVKALIEAKADVNAARTTGVSALFMAAVGGHAETVKALIEAKADVNKKTYINGRVYTLLSIAKQQGQHEVVKLLKEYGAKADQDQSNVNVYKDPEGYFELFLPDGWRVADEYRGDQRGKVLLSNPDATIQWRIIVGGGETSTLDDLKRNAQQAKSRFPNLRVSQGKINAWDALVIEGVLGGEYNRMFSFIAANEAHSFSFIGSQLLLDKEWDAIERVINTYIPFERGRSEERKNQQSLEHWIRLSKLMYETGDIEGAKANLNEAKKLAPNDPQVQKLVNQIIGTNTSQGSMVKAVPSSAPSDVEDNIQDEQDNSSHERLDGKENDDVWTPQVLTSKDRGIAFYVLAFFLLWFPVVGAFAAVLTGFVGIRYFVAVGGFIPLVLFWVAATVCAIILVFGYPILVVIAVWSSWSESGQYLPFVICIAGAITLGILVYVTIRQKSRFMNMIKERKKRKESLERALKHKKRDTDRNKCMICHNKLSFNRYFSGFTSGADLISGNIGDSMFPRIAYKCSNCNAPICYTCAQNSHCTKCGKNIFVLDAERLH